MGSQPTLPATGGWVGATWKVSHAVAQALCHFDGLTDQDLTCKLEEVKDGVARVSVIGPANGIELGALVKLKIDATYRFDLGAKRLTWLEWKQSDEREQHDRHVPQILCLTHCDARVRISNVLPELVGFVRVIITPARLECELLQQLTIEEARKLIREGIITGGMIPKIEGCIEVVEAGVEAVVVIDGRVPHCVLLELFTEHGVGTLVSRKARKQ